MGKAIKLSNIDFSKTGLGAVTLLLPLQSLSITGESEIHGSGNCGVAYMPSNTFETGVVWSITSGGEYATIDQSGVVTALAGADESSVTIRATSSVHSTIYAEKTISVSEVSSLLNVHKIFGGTVDDVIETNYKLLGSEMTNWTLLVCAPDALGAGSGANIKTALHCMDETGSPWYGITFHSGGTPGGVGCDINMYENTDLSLVLNKKNRVFDKNTALRFIANETFPVGISRLGNELYFTTDGEAWLRMNADVHEIENTLVIGAYRDAHGDLGRFYDSNGQYCDVVLYPSSLVRSVAFFRDHGVKQAIYSLNNHTCDGTEATAVNTEVTPFASATRQTYSNGLLLQAEITLPEVAVASEQTIFGCKSYGESSTNGLKLVNKNASALSCNISSAISSFDISVTRGNKYVVGVRFKDRDYAISVGEIAKNSSSSIIAHNWPLTIGGALSALPNSWYNDRFAACIIHILTIREL